MRTRAGLAIVLGIGLLGCGAPPPRAEPGAPPARVCAIVPRPSRGGGVLAPELVGALHDESAPVIASAICGCADALGAPLPEAVRTSATLVPGRGELREVRPLVDLGGVIVDTDGALDACVVERATSARLPVHVIGSDLLPDPDPTDERVVMPYVVRVSSPPPPESRPR